MKTVYKLTDQHTLCVGWFYDFFGFEEEWDQCDDIHLPYVGRIAKMIPGTNAHIAHMSDAMAGNLLYQEWLGEHGMGDDEWPDQYAPFILDFFRLEFLPFISHEQGINAVLEQIEREAA